MKTTAPTLFRAEATAPAVEDAAVVARREEYRARLRQFLKGPLVRQSDGFPLGTDEAIIALSDPPEYTACPNPFVEEWLAAHASAYAPDSDSYQREPFAADVREGKTHPIYNAHAYHTKVPHRAIMRYILHYTKPGDVIYDGFCGTGMTGVAAQMCGDKAEVEALGYLVRGDLVWEREAWEAREALDAGRHNPHRHHENPQPFSRIGTRFAILNDLSPAAAFIAYNYNAPTDPTVFEREARIVIDQLEATNGWMFTTLQHLEDEVTRWADELSECKTAGQARALIDRIPAENRATVSSTVWATAFACPDCAGEFSLWNMGVDEDDDDSLIGCPACLSRVARKDLAYATDQYFDQVSGAVREKIRRLPVSIAIEGRNGFQKSPDAFDIALDGLTKRLGTPDWHPRDLMLGIGANWGDTYRAGYHAGYERTDDFYFARSLATLAAMWRLIQEQVAIPRQQLATLHTSIAFSSTHLYRFRTKGGGSPAGNLYVPALIKEQNPLCAAERKLSDLLACARSKGNFGPNTIVSTSGVGSRLLPSEGTLDYVFIDPPFGKNIMYSESNFLWESWLRVATNQTPEAIVSETQRKSTRDYERLIGVGLNAVYRALRPGRWMTVEFHNKDNVIWSAIQTAIQAAGFVIADVRVLDKVQHAFKQVTTNTAAKQDLVMSCYKPKADFSRRFSERLGKPEAVRDFIEQHLSMLPVVPITKAQRIERLAERTTSILYDRMIAYHLVRGAPVPMSASEFTRLLDEHMVERDDMWFLPGQEVRYDLCKLRGLEVEQQVLFVSDERSAVSWLRAEVAVNPRSLGDLTPKFMQATKEWPDSEPRRELRELLRDWFVEVEGRWANPNPDDEKHVEALRTKGMLRLFSTYAAGKGKLKEFRREALIEAFRYCWNSSQEAVFVAVCQRIGEKVLREDAQLSEAYDLAVDRVASRPAPVQLEFEWE